MPAVTQRDVDDAFELAVGLFAKESGMADYGRYKAALWLEDPSFGRENLVLARLGRAAPCGLVRIVPRDVYRRSERFAVAGISSVCVAEEHRGKKISVALMEATMEECRRRGFDFAFLFARRAADHYYTRFGFWGVAAYSRVTILVREPAGDGQVTLGVCDESLLDVYHSAHERCYAEVFGRVERSPAYWRFLLQRIRASPGLRFHTLFSSGAPGGYAILNDDAVLELGYVEGVEVEPLLAGLAGAFSAGGPPTPLVLHLQPQHVLVSAAHGFDMTLTARECPYGGHMARILNPDALPQRVCKRAHEPAADILLRAAAGGLSHHETCRLLGAWSPTAAAGEPALPYDMSVADHF